jgi:tRNA threonylcarbamoyladenosine biosynthesis protein TsaB
VLILTLRTDKPESEIGLHQDDIQLAHEHWQAHRQLAETIHYKIKSVLESQGKSFRDIEAVAVYEGPGSFTGLRIGLSVANALAMSYNLPIIGATSDNWKAAAFSKLASGQSDGYVVPEYGAEVHITPQKK